MTVIITTTNDTQRAGILYPNPASVVRPIAVPRLLTRQIIVLQKDIILQEFVIGEAVQRYLLPAAASQLQILQK